MIKLIVGKSGSGKDYLCKLAGYKMVISHTTRQKRPGEQHGVDKWFETIIPSRQTLAEAIAQTYFDHNYYWVLKEDLYEKEAFIIDVQGVKSLIDNYGDDFNTNFEVIYIECSWYKRLYRMIKRDGWKKAVKRFKHDNTAFKNLDFNHSTIEN
jgi:guanylate kinase